MYAIHVSVGLFIWFIPTHACVCSTWRDRVFRKKQEEKRISERVPMHLLQAVLQQPAGLA